MPWVAICERLRSGSGRNQNKTYVNVFKSVRQLKDNASDFVTNNPTHSWALPTFREFIIDITDQEAADIQDGTVELFHDNKSNLPLWQNQTAGSGNAQARGSFADPEDNLSAFTAATPLIDDRFIVRLYDADPGTTGVQIGDTDYDEGSSAGEQTVFLKLFDETDTASTTNAQNQQTEIATRLMIFDFTAGVTTFGVKTTDAGQVDFGSTGQFRVIGPVGEKSIRFRVFGRSLRPL